jgi:hypothetical protein
VTLAETFTSFQSDGPSAGQRAAGAWFADHFGVALPRGLRGHAEHLSWDEFVATVGRASGPLRLGHWACADDPAGWLGPQARTYRAVIAVGDRITTSSAAASGPIAALTAMLHEHGFGVETVNFHQFQSPHTRDTFVTFVRGTNGMRTEWAMGYAPDPTQSALRAVIACANRLVA